MGASPLEGGETPSSEGEGSEKTRGEEGPRVMKACHTKIRRGAEAALKTDWAD